MKAQPNANKGLTIALNTLSRMEHKTQNVILIVLVQD
jgi:hypothetical protein